VSNEKLEAKKTGTIASDSLTEQSMAMIAWGKAELMAAGFSARFPVPSIYRSRHSVKLSGELEVIDSDAKPIHEYLEGMVDRTNVEHRGAAFVHTHLSSPIRYTKATWNELEFRRDADKTGATEKLFITPQLPTERQCDLEAYKVLIQLMCFLYKALQPAPLLTDALEATSSKLKADTRLGFINGMDFFRVLTSVESALKRSGMRPGSTNPTSQVVMAKTAEVMYEVIDRTVKDFEVYNPAWRQQFYSQYKQYAIAASTPRYDENGVLKPKTSYDVLVEVAESFQQFTERERLEGQGRAVANDQPPKGKDAQREFQARKATAFAPLPMMARHFDKGQPRTTMTDLARNQLANHRSGEAMQGYNQRLIVHEAIDGILTDGVQLTEEDVEMIRDQEVRHEQERFVYTHSSVIPDNDPSGATIRVDATGVVTCSCCGFIHDLSSCPVVDNRVLASQNKIVMNHYILAKWPDALVDILVRESRERGCLKGVGDNFVQNLREAVAKTKAMYLERRQSQSRYGPTSGYGGATASYGGAAGGASYGSTSYQSTPYTPLRQT
jgi:hypothetical protein